MEKLRIYDNNRLITNYVVTYDDEFGSYDHIMNVDFEICDITDLILFLREDQFDSGKINTSDYYQFNNFGMNGSDLIDFMNKYGV